MFPPRSDKERDAAADVIPPPVQTKPARDHALDLLLQWSSERAHPDELIAALRERTPGHATHDLALVTEIVYGCVRWERALDWFVARQAHTRPPPVARRILRIAAYECLFLDRVPDHAVAAEASRLAARRAPQSLSLVNAVVRKWTSRRAELKRELADLQKRNPAIGWSLPSFLYRRWKARFGTDEARTLCRWCNQPAPVVARMRPASQRSRIEGELAAAGLAVEPSPADDRFLRIGGPVSGLLATEAWAAGQLYIQDESTAVPVDLLAPAPGSAVLDACAAPGGKTAMIAEAVGRGGAVTAVEPGPHRLARLRENMRRLGLEDAVVCRPGDVRDPSIAPGPFDAVLIDTPCTNTGVLRRRPDARWRFDRKALEKMLRLQASLLDAVAPRVRPGGVLVYATCSIEPEENGDQIRRFLDGRPGFRLEREIEHVPPRRDHDGVYAARIQRYS